VDVCGWEWCVGVGFQWGSQLREDPLCSTSPMSH